MQIFVYMRYMTSNFDVSKPLLIECSTHNVHNFEADGAIKQEVLTNFVQIFLAQAPAQKMDRGAKRFPAGSDVRVKLTKRMVEILPCTDIPDGSRGAAAGYGGSSHHRGQEQLQGPHREAPVRTMLACNVFLRAKGLI